MSPRTSAPAYPWETLETFPRSTVRAIQALGSVALEFAALPRGLGQVLGRESTAVFKRFCDPAQVNTELGLRFSLADGSLELVLEIEPALADTILSGLLRQAPGVAGADLLANSSVRGFLGRIAVEAARSCTPPVELRFHGSLSPPALPSSVGVVATLLLDGRPYGVRVAIGRVRPLAPPPSVEFQRLDGIPLKLSLVGGACLARQQDVAALVPGDVLLPGAGFWLTKDFRGSLALGSEASTRAVFFEIVGERSAKLVGVDDLPVVEDAPMSEHNETEVERSVAEAVLDAPVLIRIEVASVSMTASDFATLRPGAVIETDQRIGQLATLRIAGREVATGELVNVDGQLGVRIRKLSRGD
ncbi:MAG TPA: FliM/FliN family flagellar motor switch protein [Polyangiaceae bacterium]|nr:FliM/FliN family flagellar motor switch protein [Polyangiaceae bacterium]